MRAAFPLVMAAMVISTFSFPAKAAWINCATEGNKCAFSGTKTVRYGSATQFVTKSFTNGVLCDNEVFGDPAYGVAKICAYDDASTGSTTPTAPAGSWVYCASENETCNFSGTREVRYGTDTKSVSKTLNGGASCNNTVFGDPAYGFVKSCWYSTSLSGTTPPPAQEWVSCAKEGGTCSFSGTRSVRYGADTRFVTKSFSEGTPCNNTIFGDPAYGVVKSCWYSASSNVTPPPAPTPPQPTPTPGGSAPAVSSCGSSTKVRSGPITARSGQVIENLQIVNPNGACIVVPGGVTNVVIRNNEIGPCGAESQTINTEGVRIESGASNITIQRNIIHDVSTGLFAAGARHPIIFDRNYVYNIRGPIWQGSMVQFNNVRGGSGSSKLTCNIKDGFTEPAPVVGRSYASDHISMYNTLGVSNDQPVEIAFNRIRGLRSNGEESGSAMQLGDSPAGGGGVGSAESGYYYVHHNTVVRTNGSGIAVAGGHDIRIEDNRVENRGENQASMTGWPFAIKNFDVTSRCYNISYKRNRATGRLWAFNHDGSEADRLLQFGGVCELNADTSNNFNDRSLTPAIFDERYQACDSQCAPLR